MDPLQQLAAWPVPAAAAAVVDVDGTLASREVDTVTPWASVTKLVTALCVLTAVRDGVLALDEPAGPPGATVRHLLAHASGVGPADDRALAAPGQRRIYSNRGYELLAELLAARSGRPFAAELTDRVLRPLDLAGTELAGSPAAGAVGPLRDVAAVGRELLAPTLLDADLATLARSVAYPGLAGILPGYGRQDPNDWALGPEVRGRKHPHWTATTGSPRTVGHFGQSGSFLWVDPDAGIACAVLTGRAFGPWAHPLWPALGDDVLATYGP